MQRKQLKREAKKIKTRKEIELEKSLRQEVKQPTTYRSLGQLVEKWIDANF